jgi:hypothetical protein
LQILQRTPFPARTSQGARPDDNTRDLDVISCDEACSGRDES